MSSHVFCDGIRRRDFLAYGVAGAGLSLPAFLHQIAAGQINSDAHAKSAIFVQLAGGPSHIDTFDLKPDAPDTHRGEFRPIQTNVPGIEFCEHLPKLARCADKFAILRGVSHTLAAHDLGTRYLTSGNRPLPSLEFPGYGAVVMKELGGDPDLPHFVAVPNTPQGGGYLGPAFGPLRTGATPKVGERFSIRGLDLAKGVTVEDIHEQQNLLERFDVAFNDVANQDPLVGSLDEFNEQALAMLTSDKARQAFDLSQEAASINSMFGDDNFSAFMPVGDTARRSRRSFRHRQPGRLGHPRRQLHAAQDEAVAATRCRPRRPVQCAFSQRAARLHQRLRHRRVWSHAQDQPALCRRRPRPLPAGDVLFARWRRDERRTDHR